MIVMWSCANKECEKFDLLSHKDGFCPKCGKELVAAQACRCKEPISKFDAFCPTCGRPLK